MTGVKDDQNEARTRDALARIRRWMTTHGAPLLAENLAPGATAERLASAEEEFGVALPADLRALWSVHDGSLQELNGFVNGFNLLSTSWAAGQQESVLMSIDFARESPDNWPESGGTMDELASEHWLPFAGLDSDSLVVHGESGRVFDCPHDDTPRLVAPSLAAWLEEYASRLEADDYVLEEGFGDYYLTLRDRKAEQREQRRAEKKAAHDRHRHETPLLEQFREAVAASDEDRCIEVLKDALEWDNMDAFHACIVLLFASKPDPTFVAAALRPHLSSVSLEPDQWVDVATGGVLLENNAIRRFAESRCAGATEDRLKLLAQSVKRAPESRRGDLAALSQKLRDENHPQMDDAHETPGGWLSRLLGRLRRKS